MAILEVAQQHQFAEIARVNKLTSPHAPATADGGIEIPADIQGRDVSVEISSFSTNKLHQFNTKFNSVLKSIRIADQALADIETKVDQMSSEIHTFLKMYPPYPPGSEERVKLLKNYAGIRNEIEQFTISEDHFAGLLLGNGSVMEPDGNYQVKIGDKVIGKGLRTGAEGQKAGHFQFPELSMDAGDEQIAGAAKKLGEVESGLAHSRAILRQDVERLIESVR